MLLSSTHALRAEGRPRRSTKGERECYLEEEEYVYVRVRECESYSVGVLQCGSLRIRSGIGVSDGSRLFRAFRSYAVPANLDCGSGIYPLTRDTSGRPDRLVSVPCTASRAEVIGVLGISDGQARVW